MWKRPVLRMNYFECVLQECWQQIIKQNIAQNTCFTEQLFLIIITTNYLPNFSFLEAFMHLISNFTCKDTICKRISRSSCGIILNWTHRNNCTRFLSNYWRNVQENNRTKIQLQVIECNLANVPSGIRFKNCVRKLCVWCPGRYTYIFCIFVSCLFSPGMTLAETISSLAF